MVRRRCLLRLSFLADIQAELATIGEVDNRSN